MLKECSGTENLLGQTSLSGKKPVNRTSWGQLDNIQLHDSNGEKCPPHHCVSCQVGQQVFSKHSTEQVDWWEEQRAPFICWRILSHSRTHCIAMNSSLFENDALVKENVVHVESLKCHSCIRGNNLSFGFLAFLFYSSKSSHVSFSYYYNLNNYFQHMSAQSPLTISQDHVIKPKCPISSLYL